MNASPSCSIAQVKVGLDQWRGRRDVDPVHIEDQVHQADDEKDFARNTEAAHQTGARAALDLGAMHDAARRRIERIAPMHGTAVIPQHEIADPPGMFPGELRACDEVPQFVEQCLGLRKLEAYQIRIAPAAEIKHAPPGVGMGADQRVHGPRRRSWIVGRGDALAQIAAAIIGTVVLDLQVGDPAFQLIRQRLVDRVHAAERGVAAGRRHLERVQHARHRRYIEIGHVGMPNRFAGPQAADRLAIHHHV